MPCPLARLHRIRQIRSAHNAVPKFALPSDVAMANTPPLQHRHTIRFRGFDYSQAACYFVAICAREKRSLFGKVYDSEMRLNALGNIVKECLIEIPNHFANVEVPVHAIMPNHLHSILVLRARARHAVPLRNQGKRAEAFGEPVMGSIPTVVRSFKAAVTKKARVVLERRFLEVWAAKLLRTCDPKRRRIPQDVAVYLRESSSMGFRSREPQAPVADCGFRD